MSVREIDSFMRGDIVEFLLKQMPFWFTEGQKIISGGKGLGLYDHLSKIEKGVSIRKNLLILEVLCTFVYRYLGLGV